MSYYKDQIQYELMLNIEVNKNKELEQELQKTREHTMKLESEIMSLKQQLEEGDRDD